jgi:hypothetical protein
MTVLNFPASPALNDTYTANNVTYTWNGSYWDANSGGGGGTTDIYGTAKAWGFVESQGSLNEGFNVSTNRLDSFPGSYEVTFDTPLKSSNYTVVISPVGSTQMTARIIGDQTSLGFNVRTQTLDGNFVDTGFGFTVHDNEPITVIGGSGGGGGTTVNYNGASAWGSFDGTVTGTSTIYNSQNIASVTRTGVGTYDVVFTKPETSANYAVVTNGYSYKTNATVNGFTLNYQGWNSSDFVFIDANPGEFAVHSANAIAPQSGVGADAYVYATGASGTPDVDRIKSSYNVQSVVRDSTGVYTVTYTTPMPSDDYSAVACSVSGGGRSATVITLTASNLVVNLTDSSGSPLDGSFTLAVHASSTVTPTYTWERDGTTLKPANAGDDVEVDGNITAQRYYANGPDATDRFRGYSPDSDGTKLTFRVDNNGTVKIAADDTPGNNPKITLAADGSAKFAGNVTFARGCVNGSIEPSARFCVKGALKSASFSLFSDSNDVSGSETTKLNADGSASFAGEIRHESNSTGYGLVVNKTGDNGNGVYITCNNSTDANLNLLRVQSGYGAAGTKDRFRVLNDGSAEFAGGLIELKSSGQVYSNRTTANGACFYGNLNGTNTSSILADGSAQFAGSLTCGSNLSNASSAKAVVNNLGTFTSYKGGASTDTAFAAYSIGAAKTTASIFADGSAEFAGQVIANQSFFSQPDAGYSGMYIYGDNTSEPEALVVRPANNQGVSAQINFDGSAEFAGTVTATVVPPSDARFKENITPAKPQLADVVALGGLLKNYDWNDDAPLNEEIRSQRQLGLIAQEAEEVCPAIVKEIHRTKTVEVTPAVTGPKGRVITEAVTEELDDSYKGISQDALIMKLIGAVAELSARIETLEAAENA